MEREWNRVICNTMNGPRGYYAKWNKSLIMKRKTYTVWLYLHVEIKNQNKHNKTETEQYIYKEKIGNWQRGRVGGRREEGMED